MLLVTGIFWESSVTSTEPLHLAACCHAFKKHIFLIGSLFNV